MSDCACWNWGGGGGSTPAAAVYEAYIPMYEGVYLNNGTFTEVTVLSQRFSTRDMADTNITHCQYFAPERWDGGDIEARLHWFTQSASHGSNQNFGIGIKSIGDGEALGGVPSRTSFVDIDAASDTLYIAPAVTVTPQGTSPAGGEFLQIALEKATDSASGNIYALGLFLKFTLV